MKNEYTNQTKQHTFEELALTAAKRVDIVKIQMVKDKSLLYKYRAISCPNDGYQLMRQFLGDVDREYLIVLCLNTKNEPTNINCCHIGSINSSESITLFAFFVELKEKKQSRWLFQSQICRIWAS